MLPKRPIEIVFEVPKSSFGSHKLDAAIVIGTNLILSMDGFIGFSKARLLSPQGRSLPFHKDANGFVRSDGCIATLLVNKKWLGPHQLRNSYAELHQSGENENGKNISLTTPCAKSQYRLLLEFMLPKRRFWTDEQSAAYAFLKHFSRV